MGNKLTNPEAISRTLEPAHMSPPIFVSVCAHEPERREICGQSGMWDMDDCLSGRETGNTHHLGEIKPTQGHL